MKIDPSIKPVGPPKSEGVSQNNRIAQVKPAENKKDQAVFSDGAQILAKAMENLKDVPEVRESKLEEIQSQIVNNKYQIPYDELAQKLSRKLWLG